MGDVPLSEGRYSEGKCWVPTAWAPGRLQPEQLPFPGVLQEGVNRVWDVIKAEVLQGINFYYFSCCSQFEQRHNQVGESCPDRNPPGLEWC